MGRNSYHGGSTIVGVGGFGTFDPAEGRRSPARKRKAKAKRAKQAAPSSDHAVHTKRIKKAPRPKRLYNRSGDKAANANKDAAIARQKAELARKRLASRIAVREAVRTARDAAKDEDGSGI